MSKGKGAKPTGSLVDLRYVYKYPAPKKLGDESEGRQMLRKLKSDDAKAFMQLLTNAERHHRQIALAHKQNEAKAVDVGHDKAMQALDDLLADFEAVQAG